MGWQDFGRNFAAGYAIGERGAETYNRSQFAEGLSEYEKMIDSVATGAISETAGDPFEALAAQRAKLTELGVRTGMTPAEVKDFSLYTSAAESRLQTKLGQQLLASWGTEGSLQHAKRFMRMMAPSSEINATYGPNGELVGRVYDEQFGENVFSLDQDSVLTMLETLSSDPAALVASNRESIKLDAYVTQADYSNRRTAAQTDAIVGGERRADEALPTELANTRARTDATIGADRRANEALPVEMDATRARTSAVLGSDRRAEELQPAAVRAATAGASQEETRAGALPDALTANTRATNASAAQTETVTRNMPTQEQASRQSDAETDLMLARAESARAEADVAMFRATRLLEGKGSDPKVVKEAVDALNEVISAPEYPLSIQQRPRGDSFRALYEKNPTAALALVARIGERAAQSGQYKSIADLEALAVQAAQRAGAAQ